MSACHCHVNPHQDAVLRKMFLNFHRVSSSACSWFEGRSKGENQEKRILSFVSISRKRWRVTLCLCTCGSEMFPLDRQISFGRKHQMSVQRMDILYLNDFEAVQWYFLFLHLHLKCIIIIFSLQNRWKCWKKKRKGRECGCMMKSLPS